MEESQDFYEVSISNNVLIGYYDRYKDKYSNGYPTVKNPSALNDGVSTVIKMICDGILPQTVAIYIAETEEDKKDPRNARYVILINKGSETKKASDKYAVRLIYQATHEMESISTIEETGIVWSPDTIENTKHLKRTQYYIGFVYLLCANSPGFDKTPTPELELEGEELLELGIVGELPAEAIGMPDVETGEKENNEEEIEYDVKEKVAEVPVEDDTEILLSDPDDYDKDYEDDVEYGYEELFDNN